MTILLWAYRRLILIVNVAFNREQYLLFHSATISFDVCMTTLSVWSSLCSHYWCVIVVTSLPNIMISRLVINLRTFDTSNHETTKSARSDLSAPAFVQNRVLGNIGAPLESDQWDAELFDEDAVDLENTDDQRVYRDDYVNTEGGRPTETMVPVVCLSDSLMLSSTHNFVNIQIYEEINGDIEMVPMSRGAWCRGIFLEMTAQRALSSISCSNVLPRSRNNLHVFLFLGCHYCIDFCTAITIESQRRTIFSEGPNQFGLRYGA